MYNYNQNNPSYEGQMQQNYSCEPMYQSYNYGTQYPNQSMYPVDGNYYTVRPPFYSDQQFWKGALLGTALTLLFTNDSVQKVAMKGVMTVYNAVQGGVQEMKEKFEDIQAEISQDIK